MISAFCSKFTRPGRRGDRGGTEVYSPRLPSDGLAVARRVPLVLNTSFNENEPVVCRPEEALACFLRTKMDVLVLGSFYVERATADTVSEPHSRSSTLAF